MSINPYKYNDYSYNQLKFNLENSKINVLKELVIGGFDEYSNFVKRNNPKLFLDTRFKDEICNYLDNLMLNIIKNQIPTYGSRELREHKIIKALNNDDYFTLASIIASAARSAIAFIPTIKHSIASYYKIYEHEYYEVNFEEIEKLDSNQFNLT
jgi:hypothetical protein